MLTHDERNTIINFHKESIKRSKSINNCQFKVS